MTEQLLDDDSIADEDWIWRRIAPWQLVRDDNAGTVRPSSDAFKDSNDGSPMSAIWERLQRGLNLNEQDALAGHDGFSLASFQMGFARRLGQGVQRDPLVEAPAHVLVFGPKTGSVRKNFAKNVEWVVPPQ